MEDGGLKLNRKFWSAKGPSISNFITREFSQTNHAISTAWSIWNRGRPGTKKRISRNWIPFIFQDLIWNKADSPYTTSSPGKSIEKCDFFNKVNDKQFWLEFKRLSLIILSGLKLFGLEHEGFEAGQCVGLLLPIIGHIEDGDIAIFFLISFK